MHSRKVAWAKTMIMKIFTVMMHPAKKKFKWSSEM